MRNLKKFLALVLAMLMVCSMAVISTGAASDEDGDYTEAVNQLAALKVLKGDGNGNPNLDDGVKRYQAVLFFVQALTGKTDTETWNQEKKSIMFSDVPEYGTAIDYAYTSGLIAGRGNGVFDYEGSLIYQDVLAMAVRALGYVTSDFIYPQSYILTAQKLGLTENIPVTVRSTDALTRGQVAQIIWNMLGTEVAYADLLTGDIVYPDEKGALEVIMNIGKTEDDPTYTKIPRTTLLQKSGFAADELEGVITKFTAADEDDDDSYATVTVDVDGYDYVIAAADLGITEDSPKIEYLGLPVTLFIDCKADKFEEKYEDGDASVVFFNFDKYTTVENLGDDGNIKVVLYNNDPEDDNTYVSLKGVKFKNAKYYLELKIWDPTVTGDETTVGWRALTAEDGQLWNDIFASYVYDNGEYVGANADSEHDAFVYNSNTYNTYGKVSYRVTEDTVTVDGTVKTVVEALYTPYDFGQYNVFTLKDATTSKDADYATYTDGFGTTTKLFGSNRPVTKTTASVSKSNGLLAKTLTVTGEEIESGDFMFYNYNEVDNILTVAQNCGTFKTGRLTGGNETKDTVKINGANYKFGFKGLFDESSATGYYDGIADTYTAKLEKGKDNVKYLAVDGRIVYLSNPDRETASGAGAFDFVIATTDADVVADLLEMDPKDYEDALVGNVAVDHDNNVSTAAYNANGVYVEDGYVVMAVLNTTTGAWELGYLDTLALTYNAEDEKFTNATDVATLASFADMGQLSPTKTEAYAVADAALKTRVFALISEKDGVYKLGVADTNYGWVAPTADDQEDGEYIYSGSTTIERELDEDYIADLANYNASIAPYAPFATALNTNGIMFSTAGRTSELNIPGTDDLDTPAYDPETTRITTGADSVVVVITSDGKVAVRAGKTATNGDFNYTVNAATTANTLLSVSESLIVLVSDKDSVEGNALNLEIDEWSNIGNATVTTQYYIALPATGVETDYNEDDEKEYTITDLWSIREEKLVDVVTTDSALVRYIGTAGNVLYYNKYGELSQYTTDTYSNGSISLVLKLLKISSSSSTAPIATFPGTADFGSTPNTGIKFVDSETVEVYNASGALKWNKMYATTVKGYALNLNLSSVDPEEYDFDRMILANASGTAPLEVLDDENNADYQKYLAYAEYGVDFIDSENDGYLYVTFPFAEDGADTFADPTEGVFNQAMIDLAGSVLLVPEMGASNSDYNGAAKVQFINPVNVYGKTDGANRVSLTITVANQLVDYTPAD